VHILMVRSKMNLPCFRLLKRKTDKDLVCVNSGICTSLRRQSTEYVGCCYGEGDCDIHTGCYDEGATMGTRTTNPRILSW
jgi:hypothetical protein